MTLLYLRANRAIILAIGGYENDFERQGRYHFPGLKRYPFGTPHQFTFNLNTPK
jgi:hypothetical protein